MKKLALLFLPLILSSCNQREEDLRVATEAADHLSKSTTSPISLFRVAEKMKNSGEFGLAIKSYEQALQIDPTIYEAHIGLSNCLRQTGRADSALEVVNHVPTDERGVEWYKELGGIYTTARKPKQCINAYQKVLSFDPDNIAAINGIGVCNDLQGQHYEAQRWYRRAISKAPTDIRLKSNLGLSLALSSRTNEALEILTNVVDSQDASPRDRQNLAIAYGLAGDMEKAAQYFSQDLEKSDVQTNLAFVHKLASSQHLIPAQVGKAQAESEDEQPAEAAPQNTANPTVTPTLTSTALAPSNTPQESTPTITSAALPPAVPIETNTPDEEQAEPAPSTKIPSNWVRIESLKNEADSDTEAASDDTHVIVNPLPIEDSHHKVGLQETQSLASSSSTESSDPHLTMLSDDLRDTEAMTDEEAPAKGPAGNTSPKTKKKAHKAHMTSPAKAKSGIKKKKPTHKMKSSPAKKP